MQFGAVREENFDEVRLAYLFVDLVDLSVAPPLLAHEVVSQGKLILSRDEDERVEFETRAVARYLDTAHLRKVQHEYLRKRMEARGATAR